jgi:hypothetical protein
MRPICRTTTYTMANVTIVGRRDSGEERQHSNQLQDGEGSTRINAPTDTARPAPAAPPLPDQTTAASPIGPQNFWTIHEKGCVNATVTLATPAWWPDVRYRRPAPHRDGSPSSDKPKFSFTETTAVLA